MAGGAAVPFAAPVSSTSTTKNIKASNGITTAAIENQVTVEDFAPGVVTKSVAQVEVRTGTGDGKDQGPFLALSLLDSGRSSQAEPLPLPSPDQLANANKVKFGPQIHPTLAKLPGTTNAHAESKHLKAKKKWWKLVFRRFWRRKRPSKSPNISDKNLRGDSKKISGLDGDDKDYVTREYSKEGSGLDDGDKQVTGDYSKEGLGLGDGDKEVTGDSKEGLYLDDGDEQVTGDSKEGVGLDDGDELLKGDCKEGSGLDDGDEQVTGDSKEGVGLDDGDEQLKGDSKEGVGLDDGEVQVTGDSKERSNGRGVEDGNNLTMWGRLPFIDYRNSEAIQRWLGGLVFVRSPDYSDVPATPPFMSQDYSSGSPPLTVPSTPPPNMDLDSLSQPHFATPTILSFKM